MKNKLYNEYFEVDATSLDSYEVFNGFIDKDSRYYLLPYKLENIEINEFKHSYEQYKQYFSEIITLLDMSNGNDR
ncbi:MAG: hypothetical protein U9N49_01170 [Campylobacterota bacterium]|nr:hypothetical protein [Campylobacterota bacterium]